MWTYNFKRLASVELSFWRHINFARTMNLQSHPLAFHRFQFDFEEENRCFRTQQHVISIKCPHQFDINSFKCNKTHRYFDTIANLPNNGHRQMNDRHWIQKHQHNMHIITVNKQTQLKWIYIYWFSYFNLPIPHPATIPAATFDIYYISLGHRKTFVAIAYYYSLKALDGRHWW